MTRMIVGVILSVLLGSGAAAQEMCTRLAGFIEGSGGKLPDGPIVEVLAGLPGSPLKRGPIPGVRLEDSGMECPGISDRLVLETTGTSRVFDQPYGDRGPEGGLCPVVSVATLDGRPVLVEPGYVYDLYLVAIRDDAREQAKVYGPACQITLERRPIAQGLDGWCDGPECAQLSALALEVSEHPIQQDRDPPTDPDQELSDMRWPHWLRRGRALAAVHRADWAQMVAEGESYVRNHNALSAYGWTSPLESYAWFHPVDLGGRLGLLVNGPIKFKGVDVEVVGFVKRDADRMAVVASYTRIDTLYTVERIHVRTLPILPPR